MSRREKNLVDELLELLLVVPAWVGPCLAVIVWGVCAYLLPAIAGPQPKDNDRLFTYTILTTISKIGPLFAGLIVVLWLVAEGRKLATRRKFDGLAGPAEIAALSWTEFESTMGEMFRREGFEVLQTGRACADGGRDLRLRRGGETTLVQCKHWKSRDVGVKVVRELLGVVTSEHAVGGIVITSGRFTRDAQDFARDNPVIELIDGQALASRLPKLRGTRSSEPIVHPLTSATATPGNPHLTPPASRASSPPECPTCGSSMTLRTSKKGKHAGTNFWGCPRFPACRGIRQFVES